VDCNAISPGTMKAVAEVITAAGSRCLDAGIIGSPPTRPGVTRFYASGPGVEDFIELANCGLDIRSLGVEIGLASALKMCYAALTKGSTAIATALLVTAHTFGVYQALLAEWQISQPDRYHTHTIDRQLPVMPTKAGRWISEMEEIAKTFGDLGLPSKIHQGVADVYRFVGTSSLAEETPENRDRNRTLTLVIEELAAHLHESMAPRLRP
jgi:3-hydroxyisobutyrate dehydrogenase-like beta-hydroxyacid dehydrogenase